MIDLPTQSLSLEYCWVCEERFTEFGGAPNCFKHSHHCIPRAYGGADGPTVDLCDSHHTALHQIALKLDKGKNYYELLSHDNKKDKKLLWLATLVVNAKRLTENDPNKPVVVSFVAKGETKFMLKKLKTVYRASYASLIEQAIQNMYRKHFQ